MHFRRAALPCTIKPINSTRAACVSSGERSLPWHDRDDSGLLRECVAFAAFALASGATAALAQQGRARVEKPSTKGPGNQPQVQRLGAFTRRGRPGQIKLKEPVEFRVYQRDANGKADIPIVLDESVKDGHGGLSAAIVAGGVCNQMHVQPGRVAS